MLPLKLLPRSRSSTRSLAAMNSAYASAKSLLRPSRPASWERTATSMAFLRPARSIASLLPSDAKSGERTTRSWLYPPSTRMTHAPEPRPMPTAAPVARRTMPRDAAICSDVDSYLENFTGSSDLSERSWAAASSGVL